MKGKEIERGEGLGERWTERDRERGQRNRLDGNGGRE